MVSHAVLVQSSSLTLIACTRRGAWGQSYKQSESEDEAITNSYVHVHVHTCTGKKSVAGVWILHWAHVCVYMHVQCMYMYMYCMHELTFVSFG